MGPVVLQAFKRVHFASSLLHQAGAAADCFCTCTTRHCCKDQQLVGLCDMVNSTASTALSGKDDAFNSTTVLVAGLVITGTVTLALLAWIVVSEHWQRSHCMNESALAV
jgi:hypothetical protein